MAGPGREGPPWKKPELIWWGAGLQSQARQRCGLVWRSHCGDDALRTSGQGKVTAATSNAAHSTEGDAAAADRSFGDREILKTVILRNGSNSAAETCRGGLGVVGSSGEDPVGAESVGACLALGSIGGLRERMSSRKQTGGRKRSD